MASNISKDQFFNLQSNPNLDAADTGVDPKTGKILSKKERIAIFKKRKINSGKVFGKKSSSIVKAGNISKPLAKFGAIVKVDDSKITKEGEPDELKDEQSKDQSDRAKIEPQNKLVITLFKQVQNNSKKITLLKNIVKSNIEKVSKLLLGDAKKEKKENEEKLRLEQIEGEKDKKKKKEGLLEGVGKSLSRSVLKPVQKVAKNAKKTVKSLGNALLTMVGGFIANKAIRMIQAKMSGDTETYNKMKLEMFKGIALFGGLFLILSRGFRIIPDLIFGSIKNARRMIKLVGTLRNIFRRGLGKASRRGLIAVAGKKTAGKILKKKVGKEVGEKIAKEGAEKVGKKLVKTGVKKGVKKGLGKALAKKVPLLGLGLGAVFAAQRAMQGDFAGAALELASGAASTVPGLGTAASVAIDAALIAKDVGVFDKKDKNGEADGNLKPPNTKNEISTLDETKPNVIDMTKKGQSSGGSGGGSKEASTGVPYIPSSNSDNVHVAYSKSHYNLIGV